MKNNRNRRIVLWRHTLGIFLLYISYKWLNTHNVSYSLPWQQETRGVFCCNMYGVHDGRDFGKIDCRLTGRVTYPLLVHAIWKHFIVV